jgi:serine kinase of HPr protein (carbohydrate metabolism regulator)
MIRIAGTCVEYDGLGVILRGPSGCGKSDLALRLIRQGASLVADDVIEIRSEDGRLLAAAPAAIAGMIEARGIGIVRLPHVASTGVTLVVDLVAGEAVERMPEPASCELLGVRVPAVALAALEASAVDKVRLAALLAAGRLSAVT